MRERDVVCADRRATRRFSSAALPATSYWSLSPRAPATSCRATKGSWLAAVPSPSASASSLSVNGHSSAPVSSASARHTSARHRVLCAAHLPPALPASPPVPGKSLQQPWSVCSPSPTARPPVLCRHSSRTSLQHSSSARLSSTSAHLAAPLPHAGTSAAQTGASPAASPLPPTHHRCATLSRRAARTPRSVSARPRSTSTHASTQDSSPELHSATRYARPRTAASSSCVARSRTHRSSPGQASSTPGPAVRVRSSSSPSTPRRSPRVPHTHSTPSRPSPSALHVSSLRPCFWRWRWQCGNSNSDGAATPSARTASARTAPCLLRRPLPATASHTAAAVVALLSSPLPSSGCLSASHTPVQARRFAAAG